MCPWAIEDILSWVLSRKPFEAAFHTATHQISKTKEEGRVAKNQYQKSRYNNATAAEKVMLYQRKNETLGS